MREKFKFVGFNFTEREIRYAMSHTSSNKQAAEFLGVSEDTYKKYAKLYVDKDTGLSLYELQKKKWNENRPPNRSRYLRKGPELMAAILRGEIRPPKPWQFKYFLIKEGIFEEKCMDCGFCERRPKDGKMPIILLFLDGNTKNGKRENLKLICYNHYYLQYGNIWGQPEKPKFDVPEEFIWNEHI